MHPLQQLPELAGLVSDGVNGYSVPPQLMQPYGAALQQQHLGPEAFAHLAGLQGGTMEGLPVGGGPPGAGSAAHAHLAHLAQMLPHHYKLDGGQLMPAPQQGARSAAPPWATRKKKPYIHPSSALWALCLAMPHRACRCQCQNRQPCCVGACLTNACRVTLPARA